ncbi:MAG: cobalt-precorrin-5B (C(1))-methyltransferase [Methanoregulaceae archaeon]|nr:cobalt-precorrin-5B (C(1))-methyltransferase [Methanoregulaceae archaeon]
MKDPVTGFVYPDAWIDLCRNPADLIGVGAGRAVLCSDGTVLRRGYSTGTTASAACKAAILSLCTPVEMVEIRTNCGVLLSIPVCAADGTASCTKFAGDYPGDATAGIDIVATAHPTIQGARLHPGEGIGRFARDTPRHRAGSFAISRDARRSIEKAMKEALLEVRIGGADVGLTVPLGKSVAPRTLNARIGIEGGISILGTTGLVEPWDDHLTRSMLDRVGSADRLVVTTGRIGLRYARLLYPDHEVVLAGARIGEAISRARGEVILFGLPGLILRHINPALLEETGCATFEELSTRPEFEKMVTPHIQNFVRDHPVVKVVLINRNGDVRSVTP